MCGLALLLAPPGHATDLDSYKKKYEDSSEQIVLEHGLKVSELAQQYTTALDGLLARVKKDGDFAKTKAVLGEMERFAKEKAMPVESSSLLDIKNYQSMYRRKVAALQADKAKSTINLAKQYDNALLRLQRTLTSSDRLDRASLVHDQRAQLQQSADLVSAKAYLAEYADANTSSKRNGKQAPIITEPKPLSVSIARESERKFAKRLVEIGTPLYQDRDYSFTDVPEVLTGAIYLQPTAGARGPMHVSKRGGSSDEHLKGDVTVSKNCSMYILIPPPEAGSDAPSKRELSDLQRHGWRELREEIEAAPVGKRRVFTKRIGNGRVFFKHLSTERLYAFK